MSERWARVARGSAAAAFATFAAALSHTLGGAVAPSGFVLVVGFTFAVLVCIALAGRRVNRVGIALSVLISQLGYHGLFSISPGSTSASVVSSGAVQGLHQHGGIIQMEVVAGANAGAAAAHAHGSTVMWFAHVCAAIATIAAILFAERWMRAAVTALSVRVLPVLAMSAPSLIPSPRSVRWARVNTRPHRMGVILLHLRHRGPPMLPAAI